jgi:hypothetical protein
MAGQPSRALAPELERQLRALGYVR